MSKKDLTYDMFLEKFKPKKTTDDCYTPPQVYDAIADWACSEYGVSKENFVRPFYPGGDYENYEYKPTDIVVDNPPFSIEAQILNFYLERGIKFFLFAPALTLFSLANNRQVCCIATNVSITYDNGAKVPTSFVTNLEDTAIRSTPELYKRINAFNKKSVPLPKYGYPTEVITPLKLAEFSKYGIDFKADFSDVYFIHELDAQKDFHKTIFGYAFILSSDKAAEKINAEKVIEKINGKIYWELSEREREIINSLGEHHD